MILCCTSWISHIYGSNLKLVCMYKVLLLHGYSYSPYITLFHTCVVVINYDVVHTFGHTNYLVSFLCP